MACKCKHFASKKIKLIYREVNYLADLPFKKEYHYQEGKWIKSVYHFANGILYEDLPNRDYTLLFYNSERKNFYFKGKFAEKGDIALFNGTMHFKKDDVSIGDIVVKVKDEHRVKFVLDEVTHDKPSKVSTKSYSNGSSSTR